MRSHTSFINPEIASLIQVKEEVRQIMEETKAAESQLTERENLILSELESMSGRMNRLQEDYAKIMKLFKISFFCAFMLILFSFLTHFK